LNTFLHPQFVIQEMIGQRSRVAVYAINPHPIAIAVGTNQAYFQIVRCNFSNRSLLHSSHNLIGCAAGQKEVRYALDCRSPLAARLVCSHHVESMPNRVIVFAIFAAAMLFSTIREWSAPAACPRLPLLRSNSDITRR